VGWPACVGVLVAALLAAIVIALPIGSMPVHPGDNPGSLKRTSIRRRTIR
jgi:hypothetical protein